MKEYTHTANIVTKCIVGEYVERLRIRQTPKHIIDEKGRKYNRRIPFCGTHELLIETIMEIKNVD
jgi:hypothetical protein